MAVWDQNQVSPKELLEGLEGESAEDKNDSRLKYLGPLLVCGFVTSIITIAATAQQYNVAFLNTDGEAVWADC